MEDWSPRRITVSVDGGSSRRSFHIQSESDVWASRPLTLDFAAVAVVLHAAASGRDMKVDGPMTRRQARNLERFAEMWSVWRPDRYKTINVLASEWIDCHPSSCRDEAVLAFGGGVDATAALLLHNTGKLSLSSPRVGLGVFIGGLDISESDQESQRVAFSSAADTLSAFNAAAVSVSTNWREALCPFWDDGHTTIVSSVLHTFSQDYGSGIVASDASYLEDLSVGVFGNHMSTNHLLGSAAFEIITGAGTLTRVERVREICDHGIALKNLRVCYQPHAGGRNCGKCKKCVLTRMAIIACGGDPGPLFDSEALAQDIMGMSLGVHGKIYLDDVLHYLPKNDPHYALLEAVRDRERVKFTYSGYLSLPREHRGVGSYVRQAAKRYLENTLWGSRLLEWRRRIQSAKRLGGAERK